MKRVLVFFVVLLSLLSTFAVAKDKHAPLPAALIDAKTAYISNETGQASFADRCYDELQKWGKYKIVDSPEKADLIFQLTTDVKTVGYTHSASATGYGNSASGYGTSTAIRRGETYMNVLDAKNRSILWSEAKRYGFHSATRQIVKELRERVEEQVK